MFTILVALLEWQLLGSALVAIAYGEVSSAAIPLLFVAVVFIALATLAWSKLVAGRPIPSLRAARRIRIGLYAAYPLLLGLSLIFMLPLGIRYYVLANPLAATLSKAASLGSLGMLAIFIVAIFSYQRSLRALETHFDQHSGAPPGLGESKPIR